MRADLAAKLPVERDPNVDGLAAQIAREVPGGFGGFYLERPAEPVEPGSRTRQRGIVRLVFPEQRDAAFIALKPRLEAMYGAGIVDLDDALVVRARWDFAQLYDWYRYLNRSIWAIGGLQSSDIQEAHNVIIYGVRSEESRRAVLSRARQLGAPCGLVRAQIEGPIVLR